jgi:MoaA/NifB/PqqE/SkfB family radical SAM enzyme
LRGLPTLARRVLGSHFSRPEFPYKLNLCLTDRCNSRCLACGIWRKEPGGELTLAELKEFFRRSSRFSWIDLTGGEVTLREDLAEIAAAILGSCRSLALLHFPTNGLLPERTERLTKEILAHSPPRLVITVSLDGPREVHDRVRGVPGSFDRALDTFRRLRELRGAEVFLGLTLTPWNQGLIGETLAAAAREAPGVTAEDLHVNVMQVSGHYYNNQGAADPDRRNLLEDLADVRRLRPVRLAPFSFLERRYQSLVPAWFSTGRPPLPCQALAATCFIAADGTLYPCTIFDRPLGSLREAGFDLARLWNSAAVLEARRDLVAERCPGCWTPCEAYPAIAGSLLVPR